MKKFTMMLFLIMISSSYAQELKTPAEYLKYLNKLTSGLPESTFDYTIDVATNKDPRKLDASRKALISQLQNAQKLAESLPGYQDDTEYKDQVLIYLMLTEQYLNGEYENVLALQEVPQLNYEAMEAFLMSRNMINKKMYEEIEKLYANKKVFAEKYEIAPLNKGKLLEKMTTASEVLESHTEGYLIFLGASSADASILKGISTKDLDLVQQQSDELKRNAIEAAAKMKTFKGYKNDVALLTATASAMEFYKKEANELCPQIISFMTLSQKLADSRKALESKKAEKRTKVEIDQVVALTDEQAKAAVPFNKAMAEYAAERLIVVANYNKASNDFLARHIVKE
ncbi:MAG TPA: hypothetical protein VF581_07355 [Flavobacterium sp.]|jgi:hypothetical protein